MSDPNSWNNDDWGDFYNAHTDLTPEMTSEAANIIEDIIVEAQLGNIENTVGESLPSA